MSVRIGIAPDIDARGRHSVDARYAEAVRRGGGEPIALAEPDLCGVAGLLICGGDFDIPPDWYGQRPEARIDPPREARSRLERALLESAEALDLPVLGICGGIQLMAVHRGGTLIQDLATQRPDALDHERGGESHRAVHDVRLVSGSALAGWIGARDFGVNSSHHQSIDLPGVDVSAVGHAPDGIIEAVEDPARRFWVGVQWHPERLDDSPSRALLRAFVEAAR